MNLFTKNKFGANLCPESNNVALLHGFFGCDNIDYITYTEIVALYEL